MKITQFRCPIFLLLYIFLKVYRSNDQKCFNSFQHGDVQEQNSLIEGLADDIMPAHDEIDLSPENRRLRPLLSDHSSIVHHPETSSNPEEVSKKLIADGDDDHDEFLPSTSGTLLLSQTIDEMERSHHSQSENFKGN